MWELFIHCPADSHAATARSTARMSEIAQLLRVPIDSPDWPDTPANEGFCVHATEKTGRNRTTRVTGRLEQDSLFSQSPLLHSPRPHRQKE